MLLLAFSRGRAGAVNALNFVSWVRFGCGYKCFAQGLLVWLLGVFFHLVAIRGRWGAVCVNLIRACGVNGLVLKC